MNLLYTIGSLAAVALLIGLSQLLFGNRRASIASRVAAEAFLAGEMPGFRVAHSALAKEGDGALAESVSDGSFYLVALRGQKLVTRRLDYTVLRAVSRSGARLTLRLADFTFPRVSLIFEEADAADWEARLSRLIQR